MDRMERYTLAFAVTVTVLRLSSTPGAALAYLALAAFSLLGTRQALQALALLWLQAMLSPGLAPEVPSALRYVVLFPASASIILRSGLALKPLPAATLLMGLFLVMHSLVFSTMPEVSLLKAGVWTLVTFAILSGWSNLPPEAADRLSLQILAGLALILLVSLPLVASPLGYLRNGTGFQGILKHPQYFGPMVAILGVWSLTRYLSGQGRPWLNALLGPLCMTAIVLSESRTAGLAFLLGLALGLGVLPFYRRTPLKRLAPAITAWTTWVPVVAALALAVVFLPNIVDATEHFLTKSGRSSADNLLEAYDSSRGALIDRMLHNIRLHFPFGIGFGVASDPSDLIVIRDPFFGLPVSSSVEKGVIYLAIIEETGLMGVLLAIGWIVLLIRKSADGGLVVFSVTVMALLLNLGEAVLFSPGGFGLLPLLLYGWTHATGVNAGTSR
ncbi:hypothetical protein [Amaricoccus tamworthensis]|uniref:hypothetical protein n=1 Tax=Amaricoccus tamworthensis TaxID=57002 RepID=UPI003C7DA791